jgi:hypothetical protein
VHPSATRAPLGKHVMMGGKWWGGEVLKHVLLKLVVRCYEIMMRG